ncbi:MAG TPA: hypothetical protein VK797_22060 [Tepidisphaeraceae bacterium]|nr:hypothetical protein [Tepidisphaeraceae bacterium]
MGQRRCQACGTRFSTSAAYCSNCGQRVYRISGWSLLALACGLLIIVVAWVIWAART